jgi:hypothetical protein
MPNPEHAAHEGRFDLKCHTPDLGPAERNCLDRREALRGTTRQGVELLRRGNERRQAKVHKQARHRTVQPPDAGAIYRTEQEDQRRNISDTMQDTVYGVRGFNRMGGGNRGAAHRDYDARAGLYVRPAHRERRHEHGNVQQRTGEQACI